MFDAINPKYVVDATSKTVCQGVFLDTRNRDENDKLKLEVPK
jgi:hypothetical protein